MWGLRDAEPIEFGEINVRFKYQVNIFHCLILLEEKNIILFKINTVFATGNSQGVKNTTF